MSRAPYLTAFVFLGVPASLVAQPDTLFRSGNIEVHRSVWQVADGGNVENVPTHSLIRGGILYSYCFASEKYRRMPGSYYHPRGPFGMVMQQLNWFQDGPNSYRSDARLAASLVASGNGSFDSSFNQLTSAWSEPPIAVLSMNAGTVASYARCGQQIDFYEPNQQIIDLCEGKPKNFFPFIQDARARGAIVRIFHGPLRQTLARKGPAKFYKVMVLESCSGANEEKIYLDMLTREGIADCMSHLADDGILCVHTSHRFLRLPLVLAAIAADLNLCYKVGRDLPDHVHPQELGRVLHSSSEWVMLARRPEVLARYCITPKGYSEPAPYWSSEPIPDAKHLWTDKGPNLLHDVLRGHPFAMSYEAFSLIVFDRAVQLGLVQIRRGSQLWEMPPLIHEMLVELQLKYKPDVRDLW